MRYHQIMTHLPGQGWLCVAKVPASIPDAYSIAEDIARAMSDRGPSHVFTDGRAAVGFTNGRRNEA